MNIDAWHIWIILTLIFLILEIFIPALIMSCIAFGSVLAAITAGLGGNFTTQILFFTVGTLIALVTIRPLVLNLLYKQKETKTNAHALIGTIGKVVETIDYQKDQGHVAVDGDVWKAVSEDDTLIEKGMKVMITNVNSIILSVKPLENKHTIKTHIATNNYSEIADKQSELQISAPGNERIVVSMGSQKIVIDLKDINLFYSEDKSTFLYTNNGKRYIVDFSLNELEKKLINSSFFRVNRKYIISYNTITTISSARYGKLLIKFKGQNKEEEIFVSRPKAHEFRMWFNKHQQNAVH